MKVILLHTIKKLGEKFDIKTVTDGYACNYLIPNKLAEQATPRRVYEIGERKQQDKENEEKRLQRVRETAKSLAGTTIAISAQTDGGKLFSAITEAQIKNSLQSEGRIEKNEEYTVVCQKPIKEVGEHAIALDFGDGVTAPITIAVLPQQ